jgi:hypothetical protein
VTYLIANLRFCDIDARTIRFDAASAPAVLRSAFALAVDGVELKPGWDRSRLQAALDQALIEAFGPWATGFRWAASEPGGGGPVRGYCCDDHSLLRDGETDAEPSIERVVKALDEWHTFLVELVPLFESLRASTADLSLESAVEHAAARLVPLIVERTSAEDAWYNTFARVLVWYLELAGHDRNTVSSVVENVVSGRFESWIAPSAAVASETALELGLEVAAVKRPSEPLDALSEWQAIRESAFRSAAFAWTVPAVWDAHLGFIEGKERSRDRDRARRMWSALDACRQSATRGEPLRLSELVKWQSLVLGHEAKLRAGGAFAKSGRERYGFDASTLPRFEHWLHEANDTSQPVHVRAARVYLDVCFTHPFEDGNARAARLALDHVSLPRRPVASRGRAAVPAFARSWRRGRCAGSRVDDRLPGR